MFALFAVGSVMILACGRLIKGIETKHNADMFPFFEDALCGFWASKLKQTEIMKSVFKLSTTCVANRLTHFLPAPCRTEEQGPLDVPLLVGRRSANGRGVQ